MPRRRVLTDGQLNALLALPTTEPELLRYYTLSRADLDVIVRRRREHNRLGFALQLCALRYPGRLLRPGETVPSEVLRFVADQLGVEADAIADYAVRSPTRYEQLEALRRNFGFTTFSQPHRRQFLEWLLPVALATTSGAAVAETLLGELRRRRIIAPGATVIERLVGTVMLHAERHVARQLGLGLTAGQAAALDGLLETKADTRLSVLAWARQPPGVVGHRSFARIIDQLEHLRSIALDPARAREVHPERLRQLAREGARLSAQHLRTLSVTRRRAVLVATVLETIVRLTDDAIDLFDRLIGKLFRGAETREANAFQRDKRAINDKVRMYARLGEALLTAKEAGDDPFEAVDAAIGWDKLAESVEEAKRLIRPEGPDYLALASRGFPIIRRMGPRLLNAFEFRAVPAARGMLRVIEVMRAFYQSERRVWPRNVPTGFIKKSWRKAILTDAGVDRKAYELCVFAELRDRLRAGDIWVEGSRQYRAVEDQLIARPLFDALRTAGPLPLAEPVDVGAYLAERRALMEQRLAEIADKAARDALEDVRINDGALKVTPLKAVTPKEAEVLTDRLYDMLPGVRITELLAEVDHWTGFSAAFTHLQSGLPAEDARVVLTAVLADATNLGLTRMADACTVTSYRQLAWAGICARRHTGAHSRPWSMRNSDSPLPRPLAPDEPQAPTDSTVTSAALEKRWER